MIGVINSIPWWILFLIGAAVGLIVGWILFDRQRYGGVIHIYPEEDITARYLFEFRIPPENVPKMNSIIFSISVDQKE